jgi:lysophospholipase
VATKEGFLTSTGGTRIYYRRVSPEAPAPDHRLLLFHGYGEHIGRYDELMSACAARGLDCMGFDFRGHGQSSGRRGYIDRIEDYFDDARTVLAAFDVGIGSGPVRLFGHSMGGALAVAFTLHDAARIHALALSSPYLGRALKVNPLKIGLGKTLGVIWPTMTLPAGITGDMLTHDRERAAAYERDPLRVADVAARWFLAFDALQKKLVDDAQSLTTPLYLFHGDADPVASFTVSENFFARTSSRDKTFVRYPGLLHETLNEPERAKVIAGVSEWLAAH